jgi:hypothetical protein
MNVGEEPLRTATGGAAAAPRSPARPSIGFLALLAVILGSMPSFLESPIGFYDEPALLLGARLRNQGLLPYVDFYTNYGPLGYDLMRPFLGLGHVGLPYRVAQAAVFGLLAILLLWSARDTVRRKPFALLAILTALNLSGVAFGSHFMGSALAITTLALFSASPNPRALTLLSGVPLGLLVLTRPVFAVYVGGVLVAAALVTSAGGFRRAIAHLAGCFAAATLTALAIWRALYPAVPIDDAYYAALVLPSVIFRGSARALLPYFLAPDVPSPIQLAFAAAVSVCLFLLATSFAASTRNMGTRLSIGTGALIAAAAPVILAVSRRPAATLWLVSAALFGAALTALAFARDAVSRSGALRQAAFLGLGAMAFQHYFWSRADTVHLTPSVCLASMAALLAAAGLGPGFARLRTGLLLPCAVALFANSYPIVNLPRALARVAKSGIAGPWPASSVPTDCLQAVELADRHAAPASRFVAVASSHRRTDASAILLFLLSSRRPYTRWYSYDPGLQDSPFVQSQMIAELERSASQTAVIWPAEPNARNGDDTPATPLDQRIAALYPVRLAQFGAYEVRGRAPN